MLQNVWRVAIPKLVQRNCLRYWQWGRGIGLRIYLRYCRRSCKRWLDYKENIECFKRLLLIKNNSGSNQSIDKSSLFALLLVMRQGSAICILKLCRLGSRLWWSSGVLKLVINKIRRKGHPLLLHAINK